MKLLPTCRSVLIAAGLASLLLTSNLPAAAPAARTKKPAVRVTTGTPAGPSDSLLAERRVRDVNGQELGTIKDILVDAHVGSLAYAAVADRASGELRLVPYPALQRDRQTDALMVPIDVEHWRQIPPVSPREFEAGRLPLSEAKRRELASYFDARASAGSPLKAAPAPEERLPQSGAQVVRLGLLRGKRLSTGNEDIGTINDIVLDPTEGTAAAVVAPERDLASATQRFVVPLSALNLASRDQNPITTKLTRADFAQARSGAAAAPEPRLSPTGRE